MKLKTGIFFSNLLGLLLLAHELAHAAQQRLASPDGTLEIIVSDDEGLHYRVDVDGKAILVNSRLGLEFQDGTKFGPAATITHSNAGEQDHTWENRFGKHRTVRDHFRELRLQLQEGGSLQREFGLIVRAYNDGVAFRYDLPESSQLGEFVLTNELTEFHFADDNRCWAGEESDCAENLYPESQLSAIPTESRDKKHPHEPYRSVMPLLVAAPNCYVAIAESDLLDWAGMFLTGTGSPTVRVNLAQRADKNGLVASAVPRISPWRVLMIGRQAGDLINSDLIATLATPNRLGDVSWVKPGISAWDAWWTGVNPALPQFKGANARGDTTSHERYLDFAAEMGWSYQLVDWFWYKDDPTVPLPHVDLPTVFAHAKEKGVKLIIWMHSKDVKRLGFEKVFSTVADWGAAGVKIDFMNSDSQETVHWYCETLEAAAKHHLLVDFHGAYKPTGLARTYPNYITQEGVLGNEYNKFGEGKCTPLHTITLPFTRGLLGPMDFTPGGFLNRNVSDFKITFPTQVMGTRARQLGMTVVYFSPLLVLCDSPENYRGQPGVEFFRGLPTVWDDSVVLNAEVSKSICVARRSGTRWYLAAMNGDEATTLNVPLKFLGEGKWNLRGFADKPNADATAVVENNQPVDASTVLPLTLLPAGGFAGIITHTD